MSSEIPYFVKIRGCIKCDESKKLREQTGNDYGFNHTIGLMCHFRNCFNFGHELNKPYIDPKDLVELAVKSDNPNFKQTVRIILESTDEQFQSWFNNVGINTKELLTQLDL